MPGRSFLQGYAESQRSKGNDLDGQADALIADVEHSPLVRQPTPVHEKAIDVLEGLMTLGMAASDSDTPPHMRVLLSTLKAARPMLKESFAKVPPQQIVAFMRELRTQVDDVIAVGLAYLEPTAHPAVEAPAVDVPLPLGRDDSASTAAASAAAGQPVEHQPST